MESYHCDILQQSYRNSSLIEFRALDENINRRKVPWATLVTVLDSPAAWGNGWLGMVGTLGIGTVGIGIVGIGPTSNCPSAVTSQISNKLHFSNSNSGRSSCPQLGHLYNRRPKPSTVQCCIVQSDLLQVEFSPRKPGKISWQIRNLKLCDSRILNTSQRFYFYPVGLVSVYLCFRPSS